MKAKRGTLGRRTLRDAPRVALADSITVSEERGVRYLHFGTEWVQGAMRVRKPWALELDYSRHMMAWLLFVDEPPRMLQIGLGAGSLAKFVLHTMPGCELTVVDNSEAVQAVAHSQFRLPPEDDRFEVVIADGEEYVGRPSLRGHFPVIQTDVFDADARGPALDSESFYTHCSRLLAPGGVMAVNLFGDVPSYSVNYARMITAFEGRVLLLPPLEAGNVIALAFAKRAAPLSWSVMRDRANHIESSYGLAAHEWINGIKTSIERGLGGHELLAER